ncbi:MAG TPA: hypothetical protein VF210_05690 [Pseudomonadales bacterium]
MQSVIPQRTYQRLRTLREQAAVFERYRGFDRCLRRLGAADPENAPLGLVAELYAHWGDPLSQTDENYLRSCLAHAVRARGPILQCGASLLTLVLGRLCDMAPNGGKTLWCLEQEPHWANTIRSWLTQYRIASAQVIVSRPHLFDGFVWYAADTARLPNGIALLLCQGARATASGVLGALTRLHGRLAPDCTVLARGVTRADDLKRLNQWAQANGAACVVVERQTGFVKLSLPGGTARDSGAAAADTPALTPSTGTRG